jgi:hypothetical protein
MLVSWMTRLVDEIVVDCAVIVSAGVKLTHPAGGNGTELLTP